ncbi:MAG: 4Fe-4S dicluster domain-containing protein [Candidatus Lokiarchaeota archaeon]|nr:4Fe-4S dicluster domain-containing protein [Candidatus Lokiarchaeota archaeon]
MSLQIDVDVCTGCGSCVNSCVYGGIKLVNNKATLIAEECNLCGACVEACPVEAITIERVEIKEKIDISQYKDVWIIGEHYNNKIHDVVYQLIGKGRELADKLDVKLTVVLLGSNLDDQLEELGNYGADEVIYVKSPVLQDYYSEIYVNILTDLIIEEKPEIVLIGATPIGRDFGPRVSKRLRTGLTADCTGLDIDPESRSLLLQTRPTFGGNIMATIRTPDSRPQMSTVRPGMFKIPEKSKHGARIRVIEKELNTDALATKIIDVIRREKKKINLEDAEIIVAGGRGVGSKENFKIIEELAEELNAEIAGSRVAVELGWIDPERQVGQTGKTVSPKLYIAAGISGAIQHRVGILCSDIIVAINKDPSASIFEVAHYGIVDDLHKVIPKFIEELRKLKSEEAIKT